MKYPGTFVIACLGMILPTLAFSAAPTINGLSATSVPLSSNVTIDATVSDPDGDLDYVAFAVSGPGIAGWTNLPVADVNGTSASVQRTWAPAGVGVFTVRASVYDLSGSAVAERTFEVYSSTKVLNPFTIPSGAVKVVSGAGEILTTENGTALDSVVQSGGALIVWAGGRIVLKPGFKATAGVNLFWAAIDHDGDGYSDVEEATDSDGDGMPDAWEVDHGLNMANPADAAVDSDGDGISNLNEYLAGTNPFNKADGVAMPQGYQLVLRTTATQYWGLKTSNWSLTAVSSP